MPYRHLGECQVTRLEGYLIVPEIKDEQVLNVCLIIVSVFLDNLPHQNVKRKHHSPCGS